VNVGSTHNSSGRVPTSKAANSAAFLFTIDIQIHYGRVLPGMAEQEG
jgi:hypothetical protein